MSMYSFLKNLGLGKYGATGAAGTPGLGDEEATALPGLGDEEAYSLPGADADAGGGGMDYMAMLKKLRGQQGKGGMAELGNMDYRQGMPGVSPFSVIGRPGGLLRR